jgi:hypothetical protein
MAELRAAGYAVSARYDRRGARVVVNLSTGVQPAFPARLAEGLSGAAGLGLHWPKLDADVHIPALLQGVFGSKSWMARQLGSRGGRARSDAKVSASRVNGRKGGRPRKPSAA